MRQHNYWQAVQEDKVAGFPVSPEIRGLATGLPFDIAATAGQPGPGDSFTGDD